LQAIRRIWSRYCDVLRPWLCVVTYVWGLETQAVYGTGYESLLDRLASAALLLWTGIFWVVVFCTAIDLIGLFWSASAVRGVNEFLCRSCCLLATGYYFNRWLEYWWPADEKFNPTLLFLILTVAVAYLVVRHRRIKLGGPSNGFTPTWSDCLSYLAGPILLITVAVVGGKIVLWFVATREMQSPIAEVRAYSGSGTWTNVIIIVCDSLRAQSMSLYSHQGTTTPSIDEFARNSTVYLNAHTNGSTTVPSILSILSGQHPLSHGRFNRDLPPQPDNRNLLMLLREQGYATAAVTSNGDASLASLGLAPALSEPEIMAFRFQLFSWLRRFGVYPTRFSGRMYEDLAAFIPFFAWPRRTSVNGNVADTLASAAELIASLQTPFFLFIHIHEPHSPHYLPKDFKPIPIAVDRQSTTLTFYAHYSPEFQPVVNAYRDAYEQTITEVDAELGKFFEALESKRWYDKTMVILTADHGESFEHGYLYHGEELYENSTWIPLVIRYPGQKKGARFFGLTQSIDVAPTILKALKISEPRWLEGHVLTSDAPPAPIETIATNLKQPDNGVFYYMPTKLALWWSRYKLIASCDVGKTALYDLVNDPVEQNDAAALYPDVASELRRRLRLRLGQQTRIPPLTCPNL